MTRIVCVLWRQNSEEIPTAESKTHQETEQKEEITTEAVTGNEGDDDVNVSDNDDNIPNISSPVAHLWTSKDDCRPLVKPEDATSTGMLRAQLDPTNSNLGISNCQWFWTQNHFPQFGHQSFSVGHLKNLLLKTFFSSPLQVQNSVVNLNNSTNDLYDNWFNANSNLLEHTFIDQALSPCILF